MQGTGFKWELCPWRVRIHTSLLTIQILKTIPRYWDFGTYLKKGTFILLREGYYV